VVAPASAAREVELVRKKEESNPRLSFARTGVDPGHPYLAQRNIDGATAAQLGVGCYAGPGLMKGRMVIPICNVEGKIVVYAGRAVDRHTPKYKLPVGFRKALELYNLPRAMAPGSQTGIVGEGYFDCLRVHPAGLPGVVALRGSALSPEQEKIERCEQVIIMLDADTAGRAACRTIRTRRSGKCRLLVVEVGDRVQPDPLPPTDRPKMVRQAMQQSSTVCGTARGNCALEGANHEACTTSVSASLRRCAPGQPVLSCAHMGGTR